MKIIALMIAMLIATVLVTQKILGPGGPPVVKVPLGAAPKADAPKALQDAYQAAASAALDQSPRGTVNAVGAAANLAVQQGAADTAAKLAEAEAKAAGK